jgi:acetyl-CoA synthetase
VDEDGYWFLHGRADEAMNVAGRKVGPAEIESVLMAHPDVAEAGVFGAPDELKGEAIIAYVVTRPEARLDPQSLCAHVAARLGPAFRPREVRLVAELPKTQSGKILRRVIREKYVAGTEQPGPNSGHTAA